MKFGRKKRVTLLSHNAESFASGALFFGVSTFNPMRMHSKGFRGTSVLFAGARDVTPFAASTRKNFKAVSSGLKFQCQQNYLQEQREEEPALALSMLLCLAGWRCMGTPLNRETCPLPPGCEVTHCHNPLNVKAAKNPAEIRA